MKAIIIARVSTEEQKEAGNSLPAQIVRLEKYCQNKDLQIIKRFSFDESAYKEKRSDFDDILDFVIGQKEKIAVCFDKVDRLSRNVFDKRVSLLYEKALKDEVELHFVSDGQTINSQLSAVEKFQFSMSLGLAKYYSDAISDNVKRAQEQMLRSGIYPSRPPYGYKRIPIDKNKTEIVVDEFASQVVIKAFELYATGCFSMDSLRQKLEKEDGVKWSKGFTDKILKDKFYNGTMTWNKKTYLHKYPAIVCPEVFMQVQRVKAGWHKKPFKWASKPFVFRGLIECAFCGCMITGEIAKGKYRYYHCTNYYKKHAKSEVEWIKEEDFIAQVSDVLKKLQIPEHEMQRLLDALNKSHKDESDYFKRNTEVLQRELGKVKSGLEVMYEDRVQGRITSDIYDMKATEYIKRRDDLVLQIEEHNNADSNYYVEAKKVLDVTQRAYEIFESSEDAEKRQFLQYILQNSVLKGRKLEMTLQTTFQQILEYTSRQAWLPRQDSNLKPLA